MTGHLEEQETKTSSYFGHLLVNYAVLAELSGKVLRVAGPGGINRIKGQRGACPSGEPMKGSMIMTHGTEKTHKEVQASQGS